MSASCVIIMMLVSYQYSVVAVFQRPLPGHLHMMPLSSTLSHNNSLRFAGFPIGEKSSLALTAILAGFFHPFCLTTPDWHVSQSYSQISFFTILPVATP